MKHRVLRSAIGVPVREFRPLRFQEHSPSMFQNGPHPWFQSLPTNFSESSSSILPHLNGLFPYVYIVFFLIRPYKIKKNWIWKCPDKPPRGGLLGPRFTPLTMTACMQDLANSYEADIEELTSEIQQLREASWICLCLDVPCNVSLWGQGP